MKNNFRSMINLGLLAGIIINLLILAFMPLHNCTDIEIIKQMIMILVGIAIYKL